VAVGAEQRLSAAGRAALQFAGDAATGWTLTIDQTSPVFAFLKKYRTKTVYMTIAYLSAG